MRCFDKKKRLQKIYTYIIFLFRMYLTEAQVSFILCSDFFKTLFTSRKVHYAFKFSVIS
jgi:hypothetical protein